jgi:hypothetical protein
MAKGIKTGGRTAGTPNRLTFQTRQLLVDVLAAEFENLPETLAKLEPYQRIDAVCKLAKYAMPTMQSISTSIAEKKAFEGTEEAIERIKLNNKLYGL